MNKGTNEALNKQIHAELMASHLYLAMSVYFEAEEFPGFAHWMVEQSAEERSHAFRLITYLHDRGERVKISALSEPPAKFKSVLDVFQKALANEEAVTKHIYKLYEQASAEKDFATQVELQWFVQEQVEEEKEVNCIISRLKMVGESPPALLMLDQELGKRGSE